MPCSSAAAALPLWHARALQERGSGDGESDEAAAAAAALVFTPDDAFGRLIVHGLAQFYSLSSCTRGQGAKGGARCDWFAACWGGNGGGSG